MLLGIDPLLTGQILAALDGMGHSDAICLADAHFPAHRLADRVIDLPGIKTPDLLRAVCTVLPLEDAPGLSLMTSADRAVLPVQQQLMEAAAVAPEDVRFVDRHEFYELASASYVVVRTGETRTYGNAIVRKGVVPAPAEER